MRIPASAAAVLALTTAPVLAAPQVVTDLVPTGALVQEVMGDLGEVRVLLPQGASAHHYQMRPSDAQALQSADLVVWMGPTLTPWLARASDTLGGSEQLRLLEVDGITLRGYADPAADDHEGHGHDDEHGHDDHAHDDDHAHHDEHDHDHAHDHDHDHDHGDHDHAHTGTDPHAWLSPANAGPWLEAIAATLSEQDPDNAATYRANADAAAARIAVLDTELRDRLAPHADDRFVVFHDAYGYFTAHFGLQPAMAVSLGDASTPSAARIDQIRTRITQTGARCAFPEYAHDDSLIATVIEGTGTRLGGELSPEGGMLPPGAGQYDALLTGLTDTIVACLSAE
ncbi:MAG: zinc ABC transporter substrate-binding protein [Paracoccus sp.]|nr:zinc ABC transporter substrate-binding protein [Paracoccus sp. (in: a-proteobacteria)]